MQKVSLKLLLFFIGLFCVNSHAQDPRLFDNTWYLDKVVIDGTEYLTPSNSELEYVSLFMLIDEIGTGVCSAIGGSIIDFDNSQFEVKTFSLVHIPCNLQVNIDFEVIYFDFFDLISTNIIFNYIVESGANDSLVLTLTNDNGDTAIYGNVLLSKPDFHMDDIAVYPNPVEDFITVERNLNIKIQSVKVYDALGRLVLEYKGDVDKIDTRALDSGLFFVKFETEKGVLVKKIIKQ